MPKLDDSLFDDSTPYTEPQQGLDDSLFDDDNVHPEASAPVEEGPSFVERNLDPIEAAKTAVGGAAGYGVGKAVSPAVEKAATTGAEKILDPMAEDLAYRGAGGYSGTKSGRELNASMVDEQAGNLKKGIKELAEGGAFDNGVNNRSVGREILDKGLLGPAGLGFKKDNAVRAKANLMKTSEPTNALLNSIEEYPVSQDGIFRKMKEILGYDNLNNTVPDDIAIKSKIDKLNDTSFNGIETPMQAERAKRDLQRGADFADPERTVKNAMNVAQSTARKEAVEDAVLNALGPEKLEEFRKLKAQSGSAGIASDMLGELYDKSQKPFSGFNSITGTALDFLKQRGSGIAAEGLDSISKGVKKGAKALAPGLGTLLGLTAGAAAADEQTDSADFIPGLDQAESAGSAFDDKAMKGEVKALDNYKASPAHQDKINYLRNTLETAPESLRNGFAYKQAQDELKKLESNSNASSDDLTERSQKLNKASPDQLMELSQNFQNIKGADKFVAPLENAAQASSEEERKARLFGLYQQPAFRQLLKKHQS